MINKLLSLYKDTLESVNFTVSKDGFVVSKHATPKVVTVNGTPLALPTKSHLDTMTTVDEDGNISKTKYLFNPLNENVIKGDTKALIKLKAMAEAHMGFTLYTVGNLLLTMASDPKLQKNVDMELSKFLSSLSLASKNTDTLVDPNSVKHWTTLYEKTKDVPATEGFIKLFLKKNGRHDGVKYFRLAVLDFPLYNKLKVGNKDSRIYGKKLRAKDYGVFSIVFEYMLQNLDEDGMLHLGSNDDTSPAFHSLMRIYLKVMSRLNKILTSMIKVHGDLASEFITELKLSVEVLDKMNFKSALAMIPSDADINREHNTEIVNTAVMNEQASNGNLNPALAIAAGKTTLKPTPTEANKPIDATNTVEEDNPIDAILKSKYGVTNTNVPNYRPPVQQPQQHPQIQHPQHNNFTNNVAVNTHPMHNVNNGVQHPVHVQQMQQTNNSYQPQQNVYKSPIVRF